MCLGWLISCPDRVQIPELWGNSVFISPFLFLGILPRKNEKALKPLRDKAFLMVAEMGFEPHDLRVMSPTSYQAALLRAMNDS